ncbi:MAG: MinD/ParA family ATP-binding protein, partial [Nakamurella sp.]
ADLRASRPDLREAPANAGWRGNVRRLTGGLIKLAPSDAELTSRRATDAVQRSLRGPRTVVVVNTKGGGGKTTAVYSLAATFGQARGGYVLGWDNNETRGTLAWRAAPARHTNTAVDLLRDLERFEDPRNARVGDLDNYVRAQGSAQFDVLASDENAASAASIDEGAFRALHRSLSRFYRILVIDTGNNVKAQNWRAAVDLVDRLVVVSSFRGDTAGGASWTLDHLMEMGHGQKVANAVTILSAPKQTADPDQKAMHSRFREHFAARTRVVLDVPFDPALVDGDSIIYDALSPATREAWLHVAAAIAEGL